jgi:hypothetical protein
MNARPRYLAALRAITLVAVVSLALVLLKTFSPWGVLIGFGLLQVAFLITVADRRWYQTSH